jgi:hypothetical protein
MAFGAPTVFVALHSVHISASITMVLKCLESSSYKEPSVFMKLSREFSFSEVLLATTVVRCRMPWPFAKSPPGSMSNTPTRLSRSWQWSMIQYLLLLDGFNLLLSLILCIYLI